MAAKKPPKNTKAASPDAPRFRISRKALEELQSTLDALETMTETLTRLRLIQQHCQKHEDFWDEPDPDDTGYDGESYAKKLDEILECIDDPKAKDIWDYDGAGYYYEVGAQHIGLRFDLSDPIWRETALRSAESICDHLRSQVEAHGIELED